LWQASFDGAGHDDQPAGLAISSSGSGSVIVAGWSDAWTSGASDYDYYVIQYDRGLLNPPTGLIATAASGTTVNLSWTDNSSNETGFRIERKFGMSGTYAEIATAPADTTVYTDTTVTADHQYYYQARAYSLPTPTVYSQYSNDVPVWTAVISYSTPSTYTYDGTGGGDDEAMAIAVGPDNNPVVTGYTKNDHSTESNDYFTVKLLRSNISASVWSHQYNYVNEGDDEAASVSVDNNNIAVVAGTSRQYNGSDETNHIYFIKYTLAGLPGVSARYEAGYRLDDRAVAVARGADGGIAIAGYGKNALGASGNADIYGIRYTSGGVLSSSYTYTGFGSGSSYNDYSTGISVDASGT
jgi:large repetitive protein